ncbi:MAG: META domain-containing protein, partial [Candidatus Promineifilaceae bacterium]|nr:META domain-containing protein [Candidatus Promineifilaceae bacterium]
MNNKAKILILTLLVFGMLLAACGGEPATVEPDTPQENVKTVYVGPELVDCEGAGPQKCMQIKENPQDDYSLFYDQIEGFDFEEGYEYELQVKEEDVENPPADASSIKWTLVEVVNKTPVQQTESTPDSAEAELPPEGEIVTMYVGPEEVECVGVGPQTCLQVKLSPDSEYTLFYDHIDGFEHQPGFAYELLVLVEPVENPPADASTLRYTLIEEVGRTPMETETEVEETKSLEGTTWSLISYLTPNGESLNVLPDTRITIEFKDGQIAGSAGCNNYFGTYELNGDALSIGPTGSSMRFCEPEEVMLQETAYLALLSTVTSYEIAGDQLQLKNEAGDNVFLFAEEAAVSLTGTNWEVVSYNNGNQAVISVIDGTRITAVFGDDGVMGGSAGCNNYSAGFETEGENIVIGPAASTEMFCADPEGVMDQETLYLAAIQSATVFSIDNDMLELRDDNGALQASFRAVEPLALPGSAWRLLFHNNGNEAMVSTIIDTEITAVFGEDGTLSGSAGCNSYTASYELNGDEISIGPAASTRKFCAEP